MRLNRVLAEVNYHGILQILFYCPIPTKAISDVILTAILRIVELLHEFLYVIIMENGYIVLV